MPRHGDIRTRTQVRHRSLPISGALHRRPKRAKFDMVFLADGIGIRAKDEPPGSLRRSAQNAELEPLTLLSALAAVTDHIGLVATASTT